MRVLVATDGSETATAAARTATKLLHPDAKIELVTIIPERYDPELDAGGFEGPVMTEAEADRDWEQAVSDGRQALADAEVALGGGLEAELVPTDESAGRAIVHVATERQVDLLVIGASESGLFHRLLGGSVSEYVVHHAPCPLLVVPARG